jgi:hypothetical protein
MLHSAEKVEQELTSLLTEGLSLGDALRVLSKRGYGKLLLVDPVSKVQNLSKEESRRIVVTEIGSGSKN